MSTSLKVHKPVLIKNHLRKIFLVFRSKYYHHSTHVILFLLEEIVDSKTGAGMVQMVQMILQVTCVVIGSKKLSNVSGVGHKVMRASLKGLLLLCELLNNRKNNNSSKS